MHVQDWLDMEYAKLEIVPGVTLTAPEAKRILDFISVCFNRIEGYAECYGDGIALIPADAAEALVELERVLNDPVTDVATPVRSSKPK